MVFVTLDPFLFASLVPPQLHVAAQEQGDLLGQILSATHLALHFVQLAVVVIQIQ
jgi:hypothetical protein